MSAARGLRVLFVEPFCGGSHRQFAERYAHLSRHRVELLSLPGSFWKWRLRGGHLALLDKVRGRLGSFDVLLASDMLSLAELAGCLPELGRVPKVVYFHENQLAYPVPKGEAPDVHFGFTNLSTALAADRLVFNSRFHLGDFLAGIPRFLRPMPDRRPARLAEQLAPKCSVAYPGVDCAELDRHRIVPDRAARPFTILWNHRWEFDKRPEVFLAALGRLAAEGLPFRVHLVGENFQVKPQPFLEARESLGRRVETFGFLPRRADYARVLWDSDAVVSTAVQEYFGVAVMEAAYCGARPLLPRRLAYPELFGEDRLYDEDRELVPRLRELIAAGPRGPDESERSRIRGVYDAAVGAGALDGVIAGAARDRPGNRG